jgi:hypothetical protein
MGRKSQFVLALFISIPFLFVILVDLGKKAEAASTSFTFAAAGDHSVNSRTTASLDLLANSGASFYLALGDMSYSQLTPESAWCDYVKAHVGANFPFEVLAGNHEDNGPDGLIENFAACLPDQLGNISGEYGKQYYFDYPVGSPIARFLLISPNLSFANGQIYQYTVGTARYNWVADTIDNARIAGLRWVIVGMHEDCLSIATKPCEIGADLMNLLISKKVDLVLQAHDHTYQRSKQLTLSVACPAVPVGVYDANCVVDDGSDDLYTAGNGTLFVIDATFGVGLYDINLLDPEIDYFAKWMGLNTNPRFGFMKYTVSDAGISAEFIGSTAGTFTDSFTLVAGSATFTPPPTPTQTLILIYTHANPNQHISTRKCQPDVFCRSRCTGKAGFTNYKLWFIHVCIGGWRARSNGRELSAFQCERCEWGHPECQIARLRDSQRDGQRSSRPTGKQCLDGVRADVEHETVAIKRCGG